MADKHDCNFLRGFRPLQTLLRLCFRSLEPLNRGQNLKKTYEFHVQNLQSSLFTSTKRRTSHSMIFLRCETQRENVETQINYFQ